MVVGFIGSTEHDPTKANLIGALMDSIIRQSEGVQIIIEPRFYSLLLTLGVSMRGSKSITPMSPGGMCDLLISIGGDGTFLRASKLVAGSDTAILGVNTGRLGFLASVRPDELLNVWQDILSCTYELETRSMLAVYQETTDGGTVLLGEALNEVSITRRDTASMIEVLTSIDGEYLANYVGDGVNIATPTGSTAYSMSVQGPIIHPSAHVHLICPIAPHSLNMRPLVVPDTTELILDVSSRNGSFLLAIDGKGKTVLQHTMLRVRKSDKELKVAHTKGSYSYYTTLRNKLMWGQDVRQSGH